MKRVIRLTERDLSNIVRRVINEEAEGKSTYMSIEKKMAGCFIASKYPNLYKASGGSVKIVMGLLAMAVSSGAILGSVGLSSFASYALAGLGGLGMYDGAKDIYDANISKIKGELKTLAKCVFGI